MSYTIKGNNSNNGDYEHRDMESTITSEVTIDAGISNTVLSGLSFTGSSLIKSNRLNSFTNLSFIKQTLFQNVVVNKMITP